MKKSITFLFFLFCFAEAISQCMPSYGFAIKTLQIDSVKIAYVEKGKGQTLLMVHGLGGNASHWKRNIEELSKQYRCIAIDLPGYGSSDKIVKEDASKQLDFYSDIIIAAIKKLKLKEVVLLGHSMGGQIVMITALKEPKIIKKLVLIAPAGLETFSATEAALLKNYATPAFYEKQDSTALANVYKMNFFKMPVEAEQLVKDRIALKQCSTYNKYCQSISAGVQGMLGHPVKDELKKLLQPTLILFGENDVLIPNKLLHPKMTIADVATVGKEIKNSKVVMIPKAGHLLQFEKPTEVNDAIKKFINKK